MDVGPVGGLRKKTKTKNKTAITSPAQACPVLREQLQRYRGLVLLVRWGSQTSHQGNSEPHNTFKWKIWYQHVDVMLC